MTNEETIQKLEAALASKYTPEALKENMRTKIDQLKSKGYSGIFNVPKKEYYLNSELKSVTVKRDGKNVTFKATDVLNGANFNKVVDKKERGGKLDDVATYYPISEVTQIVTTDGEILKPDNGYWVKDDAEPIFEFGGFVESTTKDFSIPRLQKGGDIDKEKTKIIELDIFPNDSGIDKDPDNDYWYWYNTSADVVTTNFKTKKEAYESLLRFLEIRSKLFDFYKKLGYNEDEKPSNEMVHGHYGEEIVKVSQLINKTGNLKAAFDIVERGEGFDPSDKDLFFKMMLPFKKGKTAKNINDGRKGNGNPIFDKAKEIRLPGEKWMDAVKRAKDLV